MTERNNGTKREGIISKEIIRMKISPDIVGLSLRSIDMNLRVGPPNIWIIRGNKAVIIDTGFGKPAEIKLVSSALEDLGNPTVGYIFITHDHPDHSGGVKELKELTQAKVISGDATESLKTGKNKLIEETDLGRETKLKILRTPGHTADSITVFDEKSRTLFTGDTVISSMNTVIVDRELMGEYMQSLLNLVGLMSSRIAPGHGHPVENSELKLQRIIMHREQREKQIMKLIKLGMKSAEEIAEEIYPENLVNLGINQIESHLFDLRKRGLII